MKTRAVSNFLRLLDTDPQLAAALKTLGINVGGAAYTVTAQALWCAFLARRTNGYGKYASLAYFCMSLSYYASIAPKIEEVVKGMTKMDVEEAVNVLRAAWGEAQGPYTRGSRIADVENFVRPD